MSIRLDQVTLSTLHEAYRNYDTVPTSVDVAGPVSAGVYAEFTTTVPLNRSGTRADIYYEIDSNGEKRLLSAGARIDGGLPGDSDTIAYPIIRYGANSVTVGVGIINNIFEFVGIYTFDFTIVQYDAPIS